jgi:hypothetical protein
MFVQLLEDFVGLLLVVPECRIGADFFKIVDLLLACIDVKDTPVTVPGVPRWPAVFLFAVRTCAVSLSVWLSVAMRSGIF